MSINGQIVNVFACAVSQSDLDIFKIERGSCDGQQALEGLAILVAMRIRNDAADCKRVRLTVKSDNVGALTLLLKMRPSSPQQAILARELALITVQSAFPPIITHTPGVANKIADLLSRLEDPSKSNNNVFRLTALSKAVRTQVPDRPKEWYRALSAAVPRGK